tara:strand:- start:45 stop:356 length:312 start_codon:yes stop_codon:yes gene_type:complete
MKSLTLRIVFKKIKLFFNQLLDLNLTKLYKNFIKIFPQIVFILMTIFIYLFVVGALGELYSDTVSGRSDYKNFIVGVASGIILFFPLIVVLKKIWRVLIAKLR